MSGNVIRGPSSLTDNSVTDAKLRDSAALSVIGRSVNSSGDPGDIAAGNDGDVLRRSGSTLGFGSIVASGIADNAITDAKIRDSLAWSVIGRSANSSGDPADIAAGSDGDVLRVSGTSLGFGAIPESSVTGLVGDLAAISASLAARPTGSGTANTIAKWTGVSALGNSLLTDDGTTFAINTNKFTVVEASGNTSIAGTLGVTGDFAVNTNKFTVAASSGNTLVAGTLDVTSDLKVNTNKFTVTASNGNTLAAGTLDVTSDLKVNTNKFTVTASNGNTLVAGTLTISPMTAGSVLFAGSSGVVSQDNTNFTWDNTNKTLTVQSSASYALAVIATSTNDPLRIQNTNAAGASTMYMTDSAGTIKVSFGYANSSFAGGILTSRAFIWRNGPDFVFQNQSGAIDAMLFSGGNWNFGSTATDPGVKVRVQGALTATGNVTLGDANSDRHTSNGGLDCINAIGTTFGSLDSLTATPLAVWDSTAQATGAGGGILFVGKYTNSGSYAGAAGIKMMKENSTDGNYSFALAFGTRANGGNLTEYFRIASTGSSNFVGDLSVATNKFTVAASTGNTLIAGTLTVSTLTAGSVPFAGTAGLISQSNADFFWDNTNKRLGIGTSSPTNPIAVSSAGTSDMVSIKNTDATLWSTYVCRDNGGTVRVAYGYGNASTADTPRNSRGHIWLENGTDFVIMKGGAIPGTALMYITNSNGNVNIGSTVGDPSSKLRVQGRLNVQHTTSAEPTVIIRNSSSSGYSATDIYDSGDNFKGAYGYANASAGVTHLQSQLYFYSGGPDWSFANGTRREVTIGMTSGSTFVQHQNGSSAAVSDSNTGRIRYNSTGQKYQLSANGATYADFVSTAAGVGTANTLAKWSAAGVLANSNITDDGSIVAITTSRVTTTYTGLTADAVSMTWTPVAGTTDAKAALLVTNNGTFNTTAAGLTEYGINVSITATRSSGANSLTNVAAKLTASGAQVNRALVTEDGDVILNNASGTTTIKGATAIGDNAADAHSLTGTLNLNGAAGSNAQVACIQSGVPTWVTLSTISGVTGLGTNQTVPLWNGTTTLTNSSIAVVSSGTQLEITYTKGVHILGVTDTSGLLTAFRSDLAAVALAADSYACYVDNSATSNTTAAGRTAVGGWFTSHGSRSSGANDLTNIALWASALNGQVNVALQTESGDVVLNNAAGTFTGKGAATFTSTLGVTGNFAVNTSKFTVTASNGNTLVDGTLTVNSSATLGDGSADAHTLNGNITFQNAPSGGHFKVGSIQSRIFLARQILTSSSGTYTPTTGTKAAHVMMVGGGGGGGGAGGGSGARTAGGGGSSGVYWEKWIDSGTSTFTGGAYAVGAAGSAGSSSGGTGGNGGDTTLIIYGSPASPGYVAKGGTGNAGLTADSWVPAVNPQSGSSSGSDVMAGEPGWGCACYLGGSVILAGNGGSNPLGCGGGTATDSAGKVGFGYGAGGGGANHAGTTDRAGGAGTAGVIIIDEYA